MGKINNFNKVFDLKDYYSNREDRIAVLADGARYPQLSSVKQAWADIVEYAKTHDGELSRIIKNKF